VIYSFEDERWAGARARSPCDYLRSILPDGLRRSARGGPSTSRKSSSRSRGSPSAWPSARRRAAWSRRRRSAASPRLRLNEQQPRAARLGRAPEAHPGHGHERDAPHRRRDRAGQAAHQLAARARGLPVPATSAPAAPTTPSRIARASVTRGGQADGPLARPRRVAEFDRRSRGARRLRQGLRPVELRARREATEAGNDHRMLVVDGRWWPWPSACPGTWSATVNHSIRELVDVVNSDPRRGVGHEKVLTKIEIDHQAERLLKPSRLHAGHRARRGQLFALRSTGNLSTGGTAVDKTDVIHPDNADIAVRAAKVVGLDVCGHRSHLPRTSRTAVREHGGVIVEVNAAPGFRMHVAPTVGTPRNVASPVIDMLFPQDRARAHPARRDHRHQRQDDHEPHGRAYPQDERQARRTHHHRRHLHRRRARAQGRHDRPLERARGAHRSHRRGRGARDRARGHPARGPRLGPLRRGLRAQRHRRSPRPRGIDTVEDLAFVKRLVVEVVRDDGTSVLNADDPLVVAMADKAEGRIMYFSRSPANEIVRAHVKAGGRAAVVEQGVSGEMLTIYDGDRHIPLLVDAPRARDPGGQGEVQRGERPRGLRRRVRDGRAPRGHSSGPAHLHHVVLPGARSLQRLRRAPVPRDRRLRAQPRGAWRRCPSSCAACERNAPSACSWRRAIGGTTTSARWAATRRTRSI
jgi:hypothetical protein